MVFDYSSRNLCLQEPNKPPKVKDDIKEVEKKQYDEDLMLEESVLKAMGLLQHP